VLKRRRPMVGMGLESEGDTIVVNRIITGGPAEKAGIQKHDRILAVEGVQIRSIYQAYSPTMCKQAGDTLTYRIQRGDQARDVTVVLGGSVEVESLPVDKLSEMIRPKLEFGRDDKGGYYSKPYRDALPKDSNGRGSVDSDERTARLERELEAYREKYERQQALIDSLQAKLEAIVRPPAALPGKSP
jgi:serine protease Do